MQEETKLNELTAVMPESTFTSSNSHDKMADFSLQNDNHPNNSPFKSKTPTHLVFKDLTVTIKNGEESSCTLNGVSGEVKPGEVLAIMGPSGAGKTTLLNILAGRQKRTGGELTSGIVTINGKKMEKSLRRNLGYVLQDDVFFSHLTMRQTLDFAAELRLPDEMLHKDKMAVVDEVIDKLDIKKCENTIIGGGMFSVGGLSGGERKRTSIGVELITNPALLMMDEPTSGLDSSTAYSLIKLLKSIAAREKKAIVCTIHQPSSQIFHLFDKLMLLCLGRVAYYGPASGAFDFFEQINLPCDPNWNPADYMMELLKSEREQQDMILQGFAKIYPMVSDPFDPVLLSKVNSPLPCIKGKKNDDSESLEVIVNPSPSPSPEHHCVDSTSIVIYTGDKTKQDDFIDVKISGKKWPASFKTQFIALSKRTFIETKANIWDSINFAQTFILALVCGLIWFQTPYTEESLRDRTAVLFFIIMYWSFTPLFQALLSFPTERPVITKERAAGMYRLSAYYLAKSVSELPLVILQPVIFLIIVYWMAGLNRSAWFIVSLLFLILSTITSQSIGLLIGATIQTFKKSLLVASVIMLSFMLLGGFYNENVPIWLSWVAYISPITYSYNGMLYIEFKDSNTFRCSQKITTFDACKLSNSTARITGGEVFEKMSQGMELWVCVLALMVYTFILRLFAYLSLRYLNKPK
eukprot:gene15415-16989_t